MRHDKQTYSLEVEEIIFELRAERSGCKHPVVHSELVDTGQTPASIGPSQVNLLIYSKRSTVISGRSIGNTRYSFVDSSRKSPGSP